jgi:hypothetical protein
LSNVVRFPTTIPNADFEVTDDDVRADRLSTLLTRMKDRADTFTDSAEDRADMINDALDVIRLLLR